MFIVYHRHQPTGLQGLFGDPLPRVLQPVKEVVGKSQVCSGSDSTELATPVMSAYVCKSGRIGASQRTVALYHKVDSCTATNDVPGLQRFSRYLFVMQMESISLERRGAASVVIR